MTTFTTQKILKGAFSLVFLLTASLSFSQALPINFESDIVTSDFEDFDGGVATVISNPQSSGINTSATVAQIIRNGGQIWAGSKVKLANNLDFSSMNSITMKVFTTAAIGTTVKFKLEGTGSTEIDVKTTVTNEWETLSWDFTGQPANFNYLVFMFDFGNVGDGSATSTFLFDDIQQVSAGSQIDLPVDFQSNTVNYTMTDFGGNNSALVFDPEDNTNLVIQCIKTSTAADWAGTTIGTPAGFATNIPLTLSDSKMSVRVWSPDSDIIVKLKVEDSSDPTHTCETEAKTTVASGWETLIFDFTKESMGTAKLSDGLTNGWIYNMASIFFNFGVDGATAGEKTYYFDDVKFGAPAVGLSEINQTMDVKIFPNPTTSLWNVVSTEQALSLELFDFHGSLLTSYQTNNGSINIDATVLASGFYMAKVSTSDKTSFYRLIKK